MREFTAPVKCPAIRSTPVLLALAALSAADAGGGTPPEAAPRVLHVSPAGDDAHAGTAAAPLRTLAAAANLAGAGDTVVIHAGTYRETLAFAHSGTGEKPIVFAAAPGEKVVVSAADPVAGWEPWKDGILSAPMGWTLGAGFDQVFSDGLMLPQARWPHQGGADPLHPRTAPMRALAGGVVCDALPGGAHFWKGGLVVGRFDKAWYWQAARITDSSADGVLQLAEQTKPWFVSQPARPGRAGAGARTDEGFVTGVLGAVEEPGEWHCQEGRLYLKPPAGKPVSGTQIEAKRRPWCVDFNGQSWVQLRGVQLFGGAVRMNGDHGVLAGCQARYLSHFIAFPWGGGSGDGGANKGHQGVFISGSHNQLRQCHLAWSAGSGVVMAGDDNEVARCAIHNTAYAGTQSAALTVTGRGNRVLLNTASLSGRAIANLTGAKAAVVRGNDFSQAGLLCKDLGIVGQWGTKADGTRISYNWVHDNKEAGANHPGIYLDNYSQGFTVDHNVIWGCPDDDGVRANGPAKGHLVFNNTLIGGDGLGRHVFTCKLPRIPPEWVDNELTYQVTYANNLWLKEDPGTQLRDPAKRDFRLKPDAGGVGKGRPVPAAPPGAAGADLGACPAAGPDWRPGQDGFLPENLP